MDDIDTKIIEFFKTNVNPDDASIHKMSDDLGINAHEFEARIYAILSSFLSQGKSKGQDVKDIDPELLKTGMDIEMEHTDNPALAKKIVMDHVTESGWDYYRELPKMEAKLKNSKISSALDEIASSIGKI